MNMKKFGLALTLSMTLAMGVIAQQNLDPVFLITGVNGDCQISLPGQTEFVAVEESKAYPYGSRILTASRSSLIINISAGNVVRVLANADVIMDENTSNPKVKNVRLNESEVEVELNRHFHEGGNALNVETATAICGAVGTHFRVASRLEQDLRIIIFRVISGIISVYGDNFEVIKMKADNWLSLLSPADRSFLRLKNEKGEFGINVKTEDGPDRTLSTKEGHVLQIWQRVIPETGERVITLVLTSPDGEMLENITITFAEGDKSPFGVDGPVGWDEEDDQDQPDRPDRGERDNPVPSDDFLDELIAEVLDDVNVEFLPDPPKPPQPPTPTPVGRR